MLLKAKNLVLRERPVVRFLGSQHKPALETLRYGQSKDAGPDSDVKTIMTRPVIPNRDMCQFAIYLTLEWCMGPLNGFCKTAYLGCVRRYTTLVPSHLRESTHGKCRPLWSPL